MSPIANKPLLRYLRIGWSVFFGVLCLLLIGLWIRSYWYCDLLWFQPTSTLGIGGGSFEGDVRGGYDQHSGDESFFSFQSEYLKTVKPSELQMWRRDIPDMGFDVQFLPQSSIQIDVPHYFALLLLALAAALPNWRWLLQGIHRMPRRFSLRTLLIFTTLVAVVLGIIVWAVRD